MLIAEKKAIALKVAIQSNLKKVWVNSFGECFSSENLAGLSDKKENIHSFEFTDDDLNRPTKQDEVAAKAAVIAKIAKAKTQDATNALLKGYEADEDVKAAIDAKVAELNDADAKAKADAKEVVLRKIAAGKKKENIEALIAGYEDDEEVKAAIADKVASLGV